MPNLSSPSKTLDPISHSAPPRRLVLGPAQTREATFARELHSQRQHLQAYALKLSKNIGRAEDLVQETIVRAFIRRDQYQDGTNLKAWMRTLLFHIFVTEHRKRKREVLVDSFPRDASEPSPQPNLDECNLQKALGKLEPDFRNVLMLVDAQGCSYEEAAEEMNCPIGTVMSRLHRARKKARELLCAENPWMAAEYAKAA